MPVTYAIDEQRGIISVTLSGQVTAADITDYLTATRSDPAFRPTMHRLIVAQGVDGFPSLQEVQVLTKRPERPAPLPAHRIAAVADSPLGLGMIAIFFGHWGLSDHYRLFDDVPSALAWLASEDAAR